MRESQIVKPKMAQIFAPVQGAMSWLHSSGTSSCLHLQTEGAWCWQYQVCYVKL